MSYHRFGRRNRYFERRRLARLLKTAREGASIMYSTWMATVPRCKLNLEEIISKRVGPSQPERSVYGDV